MDRLTTSNWGIKPKHHKMLYQFVAEPIILYVASIWYTGKVAEANRLLSIQWGLLLCVTNRCRTNSTDALYVLSGVFSWTYLRIWTGIHASRQVSRVLTVPGSTLSQSTSGVLPIDVKTSVESHGLGTSFLGWRDLTTRMDPSSRTTS